MKKPDYSIYLVTDNLCIGERSLLECVEAALRGGVTLVQYRSKSADSGSMYLEAKALKALCDSYGVSLIINDRLDVALAVGAAGVHLGQSDLPADVVRALVKEDFIVGVSAHNVGEALAAQAAGASYLGCGAVFGTATKNDTGTLGLAELKNISEAVSLPVVGIGGINAQNYQKVLEAGADGAAIVSGILAAVDIEAEVRELLKLRDAFKTA